MNEVTTITAETKTVRFWACGGTGIDLLRDHCERQQLAKDKECFANEQYTYLDTSAANMNGVSAEHFYRLKGEDGGGKDREKVKAALLPVLPEILMKFPAADLNVILFSTAGGTGSAMGPYVMAHLAKAGHSVVALVIDDHRSDTAVANSINTMTDLESIAQGLDQVIPVHYVKNDPTKTELDNDAESKFVMSALSILASGKNSKLDRTDIEHFLNYKKVTGHKAGVARLNVTTKKDELTAVGSVASFAAVLATEMSIVPAIEMGYDAIGYFPEGHGYDQDFYFYINPGMDEVIDGLIKSRDALEMKKRVNVQSSSLLGGGAAFNGNTGINF